MSELLRTIVGLIGLTVLIGSFLLIFVLCTSLHFFPPESESAQRRRERDATREKQRRLDESMRRYRDQKFIP